MTGFYQIVTPDGNTFVTTAKGKDSGVDIFGRPIAHNLKETIRQTNYYNTSHLTTEQLLRLSNNPNKSQQQRAQAYSDLRKRGKQNITQSALILSGGTVNAIAQSNAQNILNQNSPSLLPSKNPSLKNPNYSPLNKSTPNLSNFGKVPRPAQFTPQPIKSPSIVATSPLRPKFNLSINKGIIPTPSIAKGRLPNTGNLNVKPNYTGTTQTIPTTQAQAKANLQRTLNQKPTFLQRVAKAILQSRGQSQSGFIQLPVKSPQKPTTRATRSNKPIPLLPQNTPPPPYRGLTHNPPQRGFLRWFPPIPRWFLPLNNPRRSNPSRGNTQGVSGGMPVSITAPINIPSVPITPIVNNSTTQKKYDVTWLARFIFPTSLDGSTLPLIVTGTYFYTRTTTNFTASSGGEYRAVYGSNVWTNYPNHCNSLFRFCTGNQPFTTRNLTVIQPMPPDKIYTVGEWFGSVTLDSWSIQAIPQQTPPTIIQGVNSQPTVYKPSYFRPVTPPPLPLRRKRRIKNFITPSPYPQPKISPKPSKKRKRKINPLPFANPIPPNTPRTPQSPTISPIRFNPVNPIPYPVIKPTRKRNPMSKPIFNPNPIPQVPNSPNPTPVIPTNPNTPSNNNVIPLRPPNSNNVVNLNPNLRPTPVNPQPVPVVQTPQATQCQQSQACQSQHPTSGNTPSQSCAWIADRGNVVSKVTTTDTNVKLTNTTLNTIQTVQLGAIQATVTGIQGAITGIGAQLTTVGTNLVLLMQTVGTVASTSTATLFGWLNAFSQALRLDRVLNAMSVVLQIHNAAMLSRNLAESIGTLIDSVLNLIGLKDEKGEPIETFNILGKTATDFVKSVVGETVFTGVSEGWKRLSAIYTSVINIYDLLLQNLSGIAEGLEIVGNYSGKMGNALKKGGVVLSDAYDWMSENVKIKTGKLSAIDKYVEGLESLENITSDLQEVTEVVAEGKESIEESKEELKKIKENVKKQEIDKKIAEDKNKEASQGGEILDKDLVSPND